MSKLKYIKFFLFLLLILIISTKESDAQEYSRTIKQITSHPGREYYPTWSPDGNWIAFSTGESIWKVPIVGGEPIKVTKSPSNHPRWSPDGKYIAFDSDLDETTIGKIISSNGGQEIRIIPESIPLAGGAYLFWNKIGSKIIFYAKGDIWSLELSTNKFEKIFHMDGIKARPFSFSPDEKYITADISEANNGTHEGEIWIIPVNGDKPINLSQQSGRKANPLYSPDGTMIVYMWVNDGERHIYVISPENKKTVKLTNLGTFNMNPRWSPDGTKLAFASNRSGNHDIWVMDLNIEKIKNALDIK